MLISPQNHSSVFFNSCFNNSRLVAVCQYSVAVTTKLSNIYNYKYTICRYNSASSVPGTTKYSTLNTVAEVHNYASACDIKEKDRR